MVKNHPDPHEIGGTWGSREAAAEYLRGAAARAETFGPATERMLALANMRLGSRVLDVGAGAGDQILAAARRVGPTGFVLATDISTSMLEIAVTLAREAGLSNVGTQVMDAQDLKLEAGSFEAVISRNALMLIPDIHKALSEMRRVLRSGGRTAAIVFSTPEKCPYLSIPHTIAGVLVAWRRRQRSSLVNSDLVVPAPWSRPTGTPASATWPSKSFRRDAGFRLSPRPCST